MYLEAGIGQKMFSIMQNTFAFSGKENIPSAADNKNGLPDNFREQERTHQYIFRRKDATLNTLTHMYI